MVVETPSYSGVTGDGTSYSVTALSAEAGARPRWTPSSLNGATLVIDGSDGVVDDGQGGARRPRRSPTRP